MQKIQVVPSVVTCSSFYFHLCTTFLFFKHHNVYLPSLGSLGIDGGIVTIFPTLFFSYVIVYLHFFGHLFFILVLLIYDYSSTVCLLRSLFMHSMLTHAQPYCTVSVWESGHRTGKRPRPDRTKTNQDRKILGPQKTVTAVRSTSIAI